MDEPTLLQSRFFDGLIDDVRLYDGVLTAGEISALAASAPTACSLTTRYRSVGTDTADLNTSARTVEIAGTTATFSGSMPAKVGVGDVLQYQVAATWYVAFISGRTSDTIYTVQSASGGTPQAAAAGTAVNVYRAYTSLFNWEAQDENDTLNPAVEDFDTSTDLVAANSVLQVATYADGPDTDAGQVHITSAWVTGPNNYIRIYTPVSASEVGVSQRHTGVAGTGYVRRPSVAGPGSYDVLQIDTNYVRVEGLEFDGSAITGAENLYGIRIQVASGSTDLRVEHCLIHDLSNSNTTPASARYVRGIYSLSGYSQDLIKIANTAIYAISNINTNSGSGSNGISLKHDLGASYVYNNTVFDIASPANTATAHGMRLGGGATHYVKNNYVGQLSCVTCTYTPKAFKQGETSTINADNNVSFDDSADDFTGANNVINQATYASYFTNVTAGSEDFHLLADSNALWGVYGADLDSDPNLPVTIDIDGDGRDSVQPDVGADESLGAAPASASVGGTIIASATESHIVVGGKTLLITLVNDTWDATIGANNAATTALINGLDSDGVEAAGWDAVVMASLTFNDVVRTSDTVVTITLPAQAGYDITAAETITVTVPAAAVAGTNPIVATPTFDVIPVTAVVTGTITASATESHIVAGGRTLVITLTNDTWDATIGANNAATTALINGLDSNGVEPTGWDAEVKANLTFNDVVRTSDTVVTVTLSAQAGYDISAAETIIVTVPAAAVAGGAAIVASPTFNVQVVSAAITGTITAAANESHIVAGGRTVVITLTNDTWLAGGAAFNAERQNIIDGLDSAQAEGTGWDAVVKVGVAVTDVVRTSSTVVTITLPAFASYDITADETVTAALPATALTGGTAMVATPTFNVAALTGPMAAVSGTVAASTTEADIVLGGETLVITLTSDTWLAAGATFDAQRQNIIDGLDSAQAEATGWDAVVKAGLAVTDVVRTSSTVVTITLPAFASYDTTANETITATVPASAVTGASPIVATPNFDIAFVPPATATATGTITPATTEPTIVSGGRTIVLTLAGETWVAAGASFDAERQNLIDGLDSAQAEATGWNAIVKAGLAVTDVVRTSDTVVTITLPTLASYDITARETITATVPATAVTGASQLVATPTFDIVLSVSGQQEFPNDGVFTVPAGVTELTIKAWGGGGGGGSIDTGAGGDGGGGGYVEHLVTGVSTGETFSIAIGRGAEGGNSCGSHLGGAGGYSGGDGVIDSRGNDGGGTGSGGLGGNGYLTLDGGDGKWGAGSGAGDTLYGAGGGGVSVVTDDQSSTEIVIAGGGGGGGTAWSTFWGGDGGPGCALARGNGSTNGSGGGGGGACLGQTTQNGSGESPGNAAEAGGAGQGGEGNSTSCALKDGTDGKVVIVYGNGASATLAGTLVPSVSKSAIVAGGRTLTITLTDDVWDATIGASNAKTTALINAIDSDGAEATGWDAVVKANLTFNEVVRTSDTQVTITLLAEATYDITSMETIRLTVPATAVTGTSDIVALPSFEIDPLTVITGIRVAAATDDAEEMLGSGAMDLASLALQMIDDSGAQRVGLRFQNVAVPTGAVITAAYLEFTTDVANLGSADLTIEGQAADNPGTFASGSGDISSRPTTSSSVPWAVPAWDTAGQTHQSPSLVPIVQELIDRPGWASGNALVVLVSGTGRRTARSYDANPAKAPLLHIDYVPEDPACDDGNPCTYDFWDAGSASCLYDAAAADGAACSDGLYCSTGNVCSAGSCGLPIDCSFMDTQCAVGVCDEAADACIVGTESWFDTNWLFRKPITIDSTKIIGDLDDFPVLVSITDPDLAASARADGFDIAFTGSNGSTKLDHEIEKYDGGTGELVAWVRVRLSASQDKTIYMYYGNATAGDQQNATAVWNASYMSVHHMKESPDGSGGAGCDTTPTVYSAAVSTTYNVPAGCDTLTVKSWGAGGAGGGANVANGGDGGGGGFAQSVLSVTGGETLTIEVGGGGAGGAAPVHGDGGDGGGGLPSTGGGQGGDGGTSNGGSGGGGGGYSAVKRASTFLVQAAGGGGGGGGSNSGGETGGAGGAGGGASGVNGSNSGSGGKFGSGGTAAAGGGGGATGSGGTAGTAGAANAGGDGGTTSGSGGTGGGGGGAGRFGGGGGGGDDDGAGGGGGGSGLGDTLTAGSGTTAGNTGDADYAGNAGQGGAKGLATAGNAGNGNPGRIVLIPSGPGGGGGGGVVIEDSTANAHDGTTYGTMDSIDSVAGQIGNALDFDGTDDHMDLPAAATSGLSQFAFSLWVKTTESGASGTFWKRPTLFGQSTTLPASGDFAINTNNGYIAFWTGIQPVSDDEYVSSSLQVNDNAWHHVLVSNDGASASLYVDGAFEASLASGLVLNASSFWAGGKGGTESPGFHHGGSIDELRVSATSRSAAWIQTEYNNQSSPSNFYSVAAEQGYLATCQDCNDGDSCTVDSYDSGTQTCINDAAAADGLACSDGLFCTTGSTCSAGVCGAATDCSSLNSACAVGTCDEAADACVAQSTRTWYDANWTLRKSVTVDSAQVTADLTDFPVLVSVTDTDLAAAARADGFDIVFTDDDETTKLAHEIERYNPATGELVAWVKVPNLTGSTDKVLYMYYGYATSADQQNADAVWDADFVSVHHLKESPASGSGGTVSRVGSWTTGLTHTVGAGTDRLLVLATGYETSSVNDITGVTYGGQTMAPIAEEVIDSSGVYARSELWYLNEAGIQAASGTTFIVTYSSGNPSHMMHAAATYQGVDQSTPIADSSVNSSLTVDPITTPVSTTAGDMSVSNVTCGNSGSYTWGNGWTEDTDQQGGGTSTMSNADHPASGGTDTASADYSSTINRHAIVAATLNATPAVGAVVIADSTSNANDGSTGGAMDSSDQVTGQMGYGFDFDGTDDYVNVPYHADYETNDRTLSAWVYNTDAGGEYRGILGKNREGPSSEWVAMYRSNDASGLWHLRSGANSSDGTGAATGTWTYLVMTNSRGGAATLYRNGSNVDASFTNSAGQPIAASYDMAIGRVKGISEFFQGRIDEARWSKTLRTTNWIQTEYNNQSAPGAFLSLGAEETASAACGTCDDGNPCTIDTWDSGSSSCIYDSSATDGLACSDGLFCTTGNICGAGVCGATTDCSFLDGACQIGVCDEPSDSCMPQLQGVCGCDDGNACTVDSFDTVTFTCVHDPAPVDGLACDDGLFCSVGETCSAGFCRSSVTYDCSSLDAQCQSGVCDEGTDSCVAEWHGTWKDPLWGFRKTITVDQTKVPSDQTDYPMLVSLTDSDLAAEARSDGRDIFFTEIDGITKLDHELERYQSGSGTLVAWVRIPNLTSSSDKQIYMYYGNSGASAQENPTAVWDSNYLSVYHMNQNPSSSALGYVTRSNDWTTGTTHTAGSGDDRLLLFVTGHEDASGDTNVTSVSYGGQSLTQITEVAGGGPGSIDVRVSTGNDDSEEAISTGSIDRGSSDLEMALESTDQLIAIRFRSVGLPQGANITNAYVQFQADEGVTAARQTSRSRRKMWMTPRRWGAATSTSRVASGPRRALRGTACRHGARTPTTRHRICRRSSRRSSIGAAGPAETTWSSSSAEPASESPSPTTASLPTPPYSTSTTTARTTSGRSSGTWMRPASRPRAEIPSRWATAAARPTTRATPR